MGNNGSLRRSTKRELLPCKKIRKSHFGFTNHTNALLVLEHSFFDLVPNGSKFVPTESVRPVTTCSRTRSRAIKRKAPLVNV